MKPQSSISAYQDQSTGLGKTIAPLLYRGWFLIWALLLAAAIYGRPLMPIDETRYVSVAWEMWHQGDFLVPRSNGVPYSHKPPLLFWCIHLSWLLFGVNELTARMVSPLFGLANLLLSARLARRLWPQEPAIAVMIPYVLLAIPFWAVTGTLTSV